MDAMRQAVEQDGEGLTADEASFLYAQLDAAHNRIGEFADTWTSLTPDQRMAIRRQSEDLYDLMGRSATAYYYPSRSDGVAR